jgi:hypothetical protein
MTSLVYRKFLGDLLRENMVEYLYAFVSNMSNAVSFLWQAGVLAMTHGSFAWAMELEV